MTSNIVQGLWIGNRLGLMERLSISSFLHHGHEFHLYLDGPCEGVPHGTVVRDVREVLPDRDIVRYETGYGKGSVALYSDLFRWTLLEAHGGWWVDLDVVALKPFRFEADCVLGQSGSGAGARIECAVLHCPPGSLLMKRCHEVAATADPVQVKWGQIGPGLLRRSAAELGLLGSVQPREVFYPVPAARFWRFLRSGTLPETATGVHLWAQLWRHYGLDPDGRYPDTSIYEQLLRRFLPAAVAEPRRQVPVNWVMLRSLPTRVTTGWYWWRRARQRRNR